MPSAGEVAVGSIDSRGPSPGFDPDLNFIHSSDERIYRRPSPPRRSTGPRTGVGWIPLGAPHAPAAVACVLTARCSASPRPAPHRRRGRCPYRRSRGERRKDRRWRCRADHDGTSDPPRPDVNAVLLHPMQVAFEKDPGSTSPRSTRCHRGPAPPLPRLGPLPRDDRRGDADPRPRREGGDGVEQPTVRLCCKRCIRMFRGPREVRRGARRRGDHEAKNAKIKTAS